MAALHPQIVHFTVALVVIGVAFRLVSLFGRPAFVAPAATTLLVIAAVASIVSVESGEAAHDPVERVPGSRPAVAEHEEWGERTRTILVALGAIEVAALAFGQSSKGQLIRGLAAAVGLASVFIVYQTARLGGTLVYEYAGGVGLRTGNPADVERLLLAGYYHQAMADRSAGRAEQAASLIGDAAARFPDMPEVQLLAAQSLLVDRHDPQAAVDALNAVRVPDDNRAARLQRATLLADAYEAEGRKDEAAAALEIVLQSFPNARLQRRLDALKGGTPTP